MSDWYESFEPITDVAFSDCGASDAQSGDIVFGVPSSSIAMVSVVDEGMQYGPNLSWSSFEYESVALLREAITANGERST